MLQTDIVTCRAAIAVRNAKYDNKMFWCHKLQNSKNNYALIIAYNFHKTRCGQTDRPTDIATYRAAIAAKIAKYDYRMV